MREPCTVLLTGLGDSDRRLMLMYYADGMTFREVAEVFGVSESAVCLRHKAILGRLRKIAASRGLA